MGVKMGWIQIKMGHPLAQNGAENGAALAPFRANGAHPSILSSMMRMLSKYVRMYVHLHIAHAHSDVACRRLSEGSQKPGTASSAL